MLVGDPAQEGVEVFPVHDRGLDDTHVAGGRFGDHAGDVGAVLGEQGLDSGAVVVGSNQGVSRGRRGDARGRGNGAGGSVAQRRDTGPCRDQQRVDVAVVAAGELEHLGTSGGPASQPQHAHRRLGARADQTHLIDRGALDDQFGQFDLGLGWGAEGSTQGSLLSHRGQHLRVCVAQDYRTPGAHQIDQFVAVLVGDEGTLRRGDEPRGPANGTEGTDRRVHPAGNDALCPREEGLRLWGGLRAHGL